MVRYTVTIVATDTTAASNPTLVIPFEPSGLVSAFIDELFRRTQKQGIRLGPSTHTVTLHLDSETGPIIDAEDLVSEVIEPSDKLFAVFHLKANAVSAGGQASTTTQATSQPTTLPGVAVGGRSSAPFQHAERTGADHFSLRIITPELAAKGDKTGIERLQIARSATVKQLHELVAGHLDISEVYSDGQLEKECNCNLAKQLADGGYTSEQFLVVYGKSVVQRLDLPQCTETAVQGALAGMLGQNGVNLDEKKVIHHGAEMLAGSIRDDVSSTTYRKPPVVAVCSKQRHLPAHAKPTEIEEDPRDFHFVLDLHTSELPISRACMSATLEEGGFADLIVDGVIDIYAVQRGAVNVVPDGTETGMSAIFRNRAHWEPVVKQSDRGQAMFLSSLRVFASVVQDMSSGEARRRDAIYHMIDLLTHFPPALRALHLLVEGKTPSVMEAAAVSHALFQVLDDFMPKEIISQDRTRIFEGSRLLFGFILEKSRAVKLAEDVADEESLPYLTSLSTLSLRDCKTMEPVMHAVHTADGLVEKAFFDAFVDHGPLRNSHLQCFMTQTEGPALTSRVALLSGGSIADVLVFSAGRLAADYRYPDQGNPGAVFETIELNDLHHLAELCGRNKLTVHRPSQLVSAVAPSLAFDRLGHVAVYTGQMPCSDPGKSSMIFRPLHGQITIDEATMEQVIAPILKSHESDGTAVFDALGGAAVRRLQTPDEIIMFAVDVSASMRQDTDFSEVNEDSVPLSPEPTAQTIVPREFYDRVSFDEMKELFTSHESFDDMTAIVAGASEHRRRRVANNVLELLRGTVNADIVKKHKALESSRNRYRGFQMAFGDSRKQSELDKVQVFWAGMKCHEEALCDFLIFSATTASTVGSHWQWHVGDEVPSGAPLHHIPSLPSDITDVPEHLQCPISKELMEDAVTASDRVTYSRRAIQQWFAIRKSSPMHGTELTETTLVPNHEISAAVFQWIEGDDFEETRTRKTRRLKLNFTSRLGGFERHVSKNLTYNDLYKLVFRGLKARAMVFQLAVNGVTYRPSSTRTIAALGWKDGTEVTIRIADDASGASTSAGASSTASQEQVLIKLYDHNGLVCAYWVPRDTSSTLGSLLWKFWRRKYEDRSSRHLHNLGEKQVWLDMSDSGDGLLTGTPCSSGDNLAQYLNRQHCFGKLGEEPVFREELTESASSNNPRGPLVLKAKISQVHQSGGRQNPALSRLDVLKQLFETLINRLIAYSFKTHVGLITFATTAQVKAPITHVLENLRKATSSMRAEGETCIWDALGLAKDQLETYAAQYPEAKKRIVIISDGADTKSITNTSQAIAWEMRQHGIAVDSISLGNEDQRELQTISHTLGCYCFHPTDLGNALQICEMEPFLALIERPPIKPPPGTPRNRLSYMAWFWNARNRVMPTLVTEHSIPPRKEHPNLRDSFIELSSAASAYAGPRASSAPGVGRSNLRVTRIMQEMRNIVAAGGHSHADVFVSESDISFWKVVLSGPNASPYSDGTFLLYIHMGDGFPTWAPEARFVTKIKHPNVNAHGRICHSLFGRDWTSDTSLSTVIQTVFGLLLQAETSDPVDTAATLAMHHDEVEYADEVREFVRKHARKSRAEWKAELIG